MVVLRTWESIDFLTIKIPEIRKNREKNRVQSFESSRIMTKFYLHSHESIYIKVLNSSRRGHCRHYLQLHSRTLSYMSSLCTGAVRTKTHWDKITQHQGVHQHVGVHYEHCSDLRTLWHIHESTDNRTMCNTSVTVSINNWTCLQDSFRTYQW